MVVKLVRDSLIIFTFISRFYYPISVSCSSFFKPMAHYEYQLNNVTGRGGGAHREPVVKVGSAPEPGRLQSTGLQRIRHD